MRGTVAVVGDQAPDRALISSEGEPVLLAQLPATGPLVLVFLRHPGSPFARALLTSLTRAEAPFRQRGATVALVFPAGIEATRRAARGAAPSFVCLADPTGEAYDAYGLARGSPVQLLGPAVLAGAARALMAGSLPGSPRGDLRRLGGAFVVGADGRLRYAHRAQHAADNPSVPRLLAVLDELAAGRVRRRG